MTIVERLIATHRMLEHEIRRELRRRMPDAFRLAQLKKHKLAVKDRLHLHLPASAAQLALVPSRR
ncbi:YdcH family protein [Sphingomonas azotifigens]|uniref:YdcH family protein n=1 Tax=Sphingomonas azotifigens TaxID=330920 RepID=UPI003F7679F3